MCQQGYQISSYELNQCDKISSCQLNQVYETSNQCSDSCQGQKEIYYDTQIQQINCVDIVFCPVSIPIQEKLIDQKIGFFYQLDEQFQAVFAANLKEIQIIDVESGLNLFRISYQSQGEITEQLFYDEQFDRSAIIASTTFQRIYLVYTKIGDTPSSQMIDFYQSSNKILNFFVNWDQNQIEFIYIYNGELIKENYSIKSQQKTKQIQIGASNLNIFSFLNASIYSPSNVLIELTKESSSQTTTTIAIEILDQNKFNSQNICEYDKNTFTTLLNSETQEILFYSSNTLKISNLKSTCSDFLQIANFQNIRQVFVNNKIGFLIIVSDLLIYGFPFSQSLGIQDISSKVNQKIPFDNSQLDVSFCIDYTLTKSLFSMICFNKIKSKLIYLQINNNAQFQNLGEFTVAENFSLFSVQNQAILISTETSFTIAQDISTFLINYSQKTCTYQISDRGWNAQTQWTTKINIIENSIKQNNLISEINFIVNYSNSLLSMNYLSNIKGVKQIQLVSLDSKRITNIQQWIENMQYPSLVLKLNNITFDENITLGNNDRINSLYIKNLSLTQQINGISMNFVNVDLIVFDQVVIDSCKIQNSFIFKLQNCSKIIIKNIKIIQTSFQDKLSGLFQIISSDQIFIDNLQVLNCNVTQSTLFQILKVKYLQIQGSYIQNNQNLQGLDSSANIINIQGSDRLEVFNLSSIQNFNITTINALQSYYNQESDKVINEKSVAIFYNITSKFNTAVYNSQISIQSMYFFADSLNFQNNTGINSNGNLYVENADSFIQKSNFTYNQAFSGGATFFNITKFTQILDCIFQYNNAIATGGAVLFLSSQAVINNTVIQYNDAMIGGGIRIEQGKIFYVQYDDKSTINNNKAQLYGQNIVSRLAKREIYINNELMLELNQEVVAYLNIQIAKYEEYFRIMKAFLASNIRSGQQIYILIKLYDVDGTLFVYDPHKINTFPSKIQHELRAISGVLTSYVVSIIGEIQVSKIYPSEGGIRSDLLTIFGSPASQSPIFLVENFIEFTYNPGSLSKMRQLQSQIISTNCQLFSEIIYADEDRSSKAKEEDKNLIKAAQLSNFDISIAENKQRISSIVGNWLQLEQKKSRKRLLSDVESISAILNSQDVLPTGLVIEFRPCQIGEILKVINKDLGIVECLPCPLNSYTLLNNQTDCHKCPDSAEVCQNSTILLKDGYWRLNKTSDEIYPCDQSINTCLEFTQRNIEKQCKEGSIGPLCQACDIHGDHWGKKYSISNMKDGCIECDGYDSQISYLAILFCFTTFYLLYGVFMATENNIHHSTAYYLRMIGIAPISRSSRKDLSSQYIKLMTHFLQIVAVINSVSIQIPSVINFVPSFTGNPTSSLILSGNCFASQLGFTDIMRVRVFQSAFLPLVYCFSVIMIYFILCYFRLIKKFERQFIYTTIIFLIIFFQPDSVMYLLSAVGCKRIGNGLYLIADANYECYSTYEYKVFLSFFTLPALLIWVIGPMFILLFLEKRKDKLDMISTKKLFGYLYLEYKPKCYYFEFIRSCFKIIIVSIYILSNSTNSLKLNFIAIILCLYIIISHKIKPFLNLFLFHVDTITHCFLLISVIFTILHLNFEQDDDASYSIGVIVKALNIFYVSLMVLLIAYLKLRSMLQKKLFTMQNKGGHILFILKKMKIISYEQKMKALLRWKLIQKNISLILQTKFNSENIKRIPNSKTINQNELQQAKNQDQITTTAVNICQENQHLNKKDIYTDKNLQNLIETPREIQSIENYIQVVNLQQDRRTSINQRTFDKNSSEIFSVICSEVNINQQTHNGEFENYSQPVFSKFISQKNVLMGSLNQINLKAPTNQ